MKHWTIFTENTIFNFGKHKGLTLEEVAKIDARYILWCVREIEKFLIESNAAFKLSLMLNLILPPLQIVVSL